MAFQFVNATPDDIEYSAETRRRIRSQAMRDYRRRQRTDQNDDESSPEPSPPSSITSPALSAQSQSREVSQPRQSSSQSLSVQSDLLRRHSSGTSSDIPLTEQARTARGKRRSPQTPLEGEPQMGTARRRRRDEEPRARHGVFSQFMINLPKRQTPSAIGDDIDALSSPGRLDRMLDVCDEYNSWLSSSILETTDTPPKRDYGSYDNKTARMLLCALALKSRGHLEAVRSDRPEFEKHLVKTGVLALLNKRLKNASKALEDNTIGALACLASYEMSQGSSEATMHLSGLQQIIRLRGGTSKIGNSVGLRMLLEILDLTHAANFRTSPMYTVADASQPSSTEQTPAPQTHGGGCGELDQGMLDDISNFILSIPELAETGEQMPGGAQLGQKVTRNTFDDDVGQWYRCLSDAAERVEDIALAHCCRLAADVHLLTCSPAAPHPMRGHAQTEELLQALAGLLDAVWDDVSPTLHTRVLLTALSTPPLGPHPTHISNPSKSFANAHLTRVLYQTSASDWPATKALVLRFLDMQAVIRRQRESQNFGSFAGMGHGDFGGSRTVLGGPEGLGMEIVVPEVEARERGWGIMG